MTNKYLSIPAVVAGALGMGGAAVAMAAEPTTAELTAQIQELQSKVQQLEAAQTQAMTAKDVDATVDSVLRDAEKRSQLLQMEGFTAGWTEGNFVLKSADGNFVLMPKFQFQFRYVNTYRENGKSNGNNDMQDGFEIRRMKIEFAGNAFTPDLTYNFRWASQNGEVEEDDDDSSSFTTGPSANGELKLENAYIVYQFSDDMAFKVGQWKHHVFHEESTSSAKQLAVDRSLLNELLGGGQTDYVQGVGLIWGAKDSPLRAEFSYHDGYNSDNTSFVNAGGTGAVAVAPTNWGIAGRVEYLVMGNYKAYEDFTAMGNTEDLLVIGGGGDWSQSNSNDVAFHTIDVQWEGGSTPLSIYGAYLGMYRDFDNAAVSPSGSTGDLYDWGALVQLGYMFNEKLEGFGRLGYIDLDTATLPSGAENELWELTGGINYYFQGHRAKATVDVTWLPNGSPATVGGIGVLSTSSDDDEIIIRGQFQLLL
jgi:hypothetical protein